MKVNFGAGVALLGAGLALGGCSGPIDPTVGQGPIALRSDVERALVDYQARQKPRFFAVSEDGSAYYYSFCDAGRCLRQAKTQVIKKCESYSGGVPCKIYASHGTVVWDREN
jgi:hypothetical protein